MVWCFDSGDTTLLHYMVSLLLLQTVTQERLRQRATAHPGVANANSFGVHDILIVIARRKAEEGNKQKDIQHQQAPWMLEPK